MTCDVCGSPVVKGQCSFCGKPQGPPDTASTAGNGPVTTGAVIPGTHEVLSTIHARLDSVHDKLDLLTTVIEDLPGILLGISEVVGVIRSLIEAKPADVPITVNDPAKGGS